MTVYATNLKSVKGFMSKSETNKEEVETEEEEVIAEDEVAEEGSSRGRVTEEEVTELPEITDEVTSMMMLMHFSVDRNFPKSLEKKLRQFSRKFPKSKVTELREAWKMPLRSKA